MRKLIKIILTFFANLQPLFGEEQVIYIEYPIRIIEIFLLFKTKEGIRANNVFLDGNISLKEDFNILLNGRHILAFNGLKTIINENCELSFFPKIGGG